MEGCEDPFNRGAYPWGHEDKDLKARFSLLGQLRKQRQSLQSGSIQWLCASGSLLAFARELPQERTVTVVNADALSHILTLPWTAPFAMDRLSGQSFPVKDGILTVELPPYGGLLLT